MRYTESNAQCAELLRLVIPFMAKHTISANPINYAVCYAYIAGNHKSLKQATDALLNNGQILTNPQIDALYHEYIVELDERQVDHWQMEMRRIISDLSESTSKVDEDASKYSQSLKDYVGELADITTDTAVQQIIGGLLDDTQSIQGTTAILQAQLKAHQQEIDDLRNELQYAREASLTDPLTGLANRMGFSKAIEEALSNADDMAHSLCLLMVDIDHFKRVNDTYGHVVGDKVIQLVGHSLQKQVKGKDTTARYGGEEFAILLLDTPLSGARSVAETIRTSIENARIKDLKSKKPIGQITVSIGIGRYRTDESITDFIARTDAALYQSKNAGRNRATLAPQ